VIDRFAAADDDDGAEASFLIGGRSPSVELRSIAFPIAADKGPTRRERRT
jgi:hypothetical protein